MTYMNNDRSRRMLPNKKKHESTNRGKVKHRRAQRDNLLKHLLKPQHEPM